MTVANKKQNNIAKITTIQQLVKRRIWGRLLTGSQERVGKNMKGGEGAALSLWSPT